MRRTDEEFKAEVFRRSEDYRVSRRNRRKKIALACLPVLICCGGFFALVTGGFGGFGASGETEAVYQNAAITSDACMEAPAAAEEEAGIEPAEGELESSSGSSSDPAVLSIEVTSQPEMEEYARTFTDPEKINAIMDALQAFYDDPGTTIGGSEVGECEGMGYRITVTEENVIQEYTLFNNALSDDGIWYVNPACYQALEKLILQNGD